LLRLAKVIVKNKMSRFYGSLCIAALAFPGYFCLGDIVSGRLISSAGGFVWELWSK